MKKLFAIFKRVFRWFGTLMHVYVNKRKTKLSVDIDHDLDGQPDVTLSIERHIPQEGGKEDR